MVATRHGEAQAEQEEALHHNAPATRSSRHHHADAGRGNQPGQAVAAAAARLARPAARASTHAQKLHDSETDDTGSEGAADEDGSSDPAASGEEDGPHTTGGRSARAGRSLRNNIKKPPPQHLIQTFTKAPTPHRPASRAERQQRQQRQRERERQQRQQELQLQELQHQERELQGALRAAAGGSHLTRHQTRLLRVWAEDAADIEPATVDAAAGGDADAAELLAAAAAEAIVKSEPNSEAGEDEEEAGSSEGNGHAVGEEGEEEEGAEAGAAAAGGSKRRQSQTAGRGLRAELLQLKQAAAEAKAAERRRRQREAIRQAARQQRILRDARLGGSRRGSFDDVVLEYSSDEELGGDTSSQDTGGAGRGRGSRGGRRLRKRRRAAAWSEGSDGDDEGKGEDEEEDEGRRKYKLRSRDRGHAERLIDEHPAPAARPKARARDRHRAHVKLGRSSGRRRGGFSELSSDDPEDSLFPGGHWSRLLGPAAAGGMTGPSYAPAALPPTPAAAAAAVAAAATAAAAGGMLSPRGASLDRRGSAFLDAAPGTASRAVGSGWAHWGGASGGGGGGEGGAAYGGGAAAAAAGGTAADKRGAGLGQELITPLQVDPSIDFDQIGGLDQYLSALKEMVFLPLLYPEIFDKFGVNPPRGVLFHGPPGTGKTLVARALAAQASRAAGQKVSFYMRKGADLLSKWVGEAEKQLRLLFEEASKHQPAIIFFDEIDGLAPVRTSKQDQVHNSIVSTLLALMDGLESRGRVVLIGATNRPDALDPALRRPGRFDRELLFPMPDLAARLSILAIHSRRWAPQPAPALLDDLAQLTGGYCGADLRALCAEASLAALRRVYPQIYVSDVKLLIDTSAVRVTRQDFVTAMQDLTPAAHRATASHAKALNAVIEPCLAQPLQSALSQIWQLFPAAAACMAQTDAAAAAAGGSNPTTNSSSSRGLPKAGSKSSSSNRHAMHIARPRMLLVGPRGSGQQQLGAAVLAAVEGLPVHCIGLTSLLANVAARCVEEALVSAFTEARRSAPAIIYWPQAHLWWAAAGSGLRCALVALLDDLPPDLPLMLLATAELPADAAASASLPSSSSRRLLTAPGATAAAAAGGGAAGRSMQQRMQQQQQEYLEELGMDPSLAALFPPLGQISDTHGPQLQRVQVHASTPAADQGQTAAQGQHQQDAGRGCDVLGWVLLDSPGPNERRGMFKGVFDAAAAPPLPEEDGPQQQAPAQLPPAPDAAAAAEAQRKAEAAAAARVAYEEDQAVLRSLRMVLRGIVQRALTLKRYRLFAEPPMLDEEEGMQAMQCLSHPMDLLTMLYKVDHQQYVTPAAFLADAHLIVQCAEELYGQTEEAALIPAPPPPAAAAAAAAAPPAAPPAAAAAAAARASAAAPAAAGAVGSGSRDFERAAAGAASASVSAAAAGGGEEPMACSPGRQAGGSAAAAAAAGDAGAVHDGTEPAAAAAVPVLPALRVSVCKEISRAMELKDGLEQQVYQLVPPELAQACEALAARGGPAPPPPGMLQPQQLLPASFPTSMAATRPAADASNKQSNLRTTARLTGHKLDKRLLHADPEALMRARKQSKAKAAAQRPAAAAEPDEQPAADQQQQQLLESQPQQEQEEVGQLPAAAGDVEMADVTEAGLGAAAATAEQSAAADASTAAAAGTQQQPLHFEESPAALKPVTNGVSRKRRNSLAEAAAAAAAADFEASRPTKAARHTVTPEQQGTAGLLHGSSSVQPAPAAKHLPPAAHPQLGMQAADQQGDQPQQQQQLAAEGDEGEAVPVQPVQSTPTKAAAVADVLRAEQLLDRVVAASEGMRLAALELLHARLSRVVAAHCQQEDRSLVLGQLAYIIDGLQQQSW